MIIKNKKIITQNKIFSVFDYTCLNKKMEISRQIIEHDGVAAILAIKNNKLIMVKQYRFPFGETIEIPSGKIEKNEKPVKCARREFKEKTGYDAKEIHPLTNFYPSVAFSTQIVHCFYTNSFEKVGEQNLDEGEMIVEVIEMELENAIKMIFSGQIIDSITIVAILSYAIKNDFFKKSFTLSS